MGGDWHMPKLRQHLAGGGINFTNCRWQEWELMYWQGRTSMCCNKL